MKTTNKTSNQYPVRVRITRSALKNSSAGNDAVIVPTVKGNIFLKYGKHAYYFYNFAKQICVCVEISHRDIVAPGLSLFGASMNIGGSFAEKLKMIFRKYHYGFNFFEQIMLMTVPHTVTSAGDGKFFINLWSYVGYIEIDSKTWEVKYLRSPEQKENEVLGSQQWLHAKTGDMYYITYSLSESMKKTISPDLPVSCRIMKRDKKNNGTTEIWKGVLSDYLHDIMVNRSGRYCVVCELGMFQNDEGKTIPSKVLVIDMINNRHWILSKFIVAAHAQFDPTEPDVIYFSNHNFKFIPTSIITLLRKAIYSLKFTGTASVYRYQLTPDGPRETGVFTHPRMFRMTNFHVFVHRGQKIIAAMGFPNLIYFADAETMKFIKVITVQHKRSLGSWFRKTPCFVGTFSPSSDGELLYVQTTRSFQIIDVNSGEVVENNSLYFNHTAANHMHTTTETKWS